MRRACEVSPGVPSRSPGTIRRTEDPIRDTQTAPIGYQQKMEEDKDGKKGALLYSVKYNPSDEFLTAPPVAGEEEEAAGEITEEAVPAGADWWEEVPVTDKAADEAAALEEKENLPVLAEAPPEEKSEASTQDAEGGQWW